jgi:GT2 family glycosyltransferase
MTRFGCVVLTQGRRPAELRAALESLLVQEGVELEVVVVGNGWEPSGLPDGVRALALAEDVGIPAGRNAGVPAVGGELLFFLDDDARLASPDALARVAERMAPDVGLAQLRVDPSTPGAPPRDWVPRLRVGDRTRSSEVTAVWEGAVAMPRAVFEEVGGWPAEFRRGHEGVDLAWRVMDSGRRVLYLGDVAALHAAYATAPHVHSAFYGARNRVWLARRHLPWPLAVLYVLGFVARTLPLFVRSRVRLRAAARGYRAGLREPCGPRKPLQVKTLWRMTRAGRPPLL